MLVSTYVPKHPAKKSAEAAAIIIPVHNEAFALASTAPLLLSGLSDKAEVLYVCNGCTDGCASFLRELGDARIRVIELKKPSKAAALREGERYTATFPRFYVDADVHISGADLMLLAERLNREEIELVSPVQAFDETRSSYLAREANRIWLRLPYARTCAFQQVIGVSKAGRARWGKFPDVIADDTYIVSQIPADRSELVRDVIAKVRPPATIRALIGVRLRILRGLDDLENMGVQPRRTPGQNVELFRLLVRPGTALGAAIYIMIGVVARILFMMGAGRRGWYRDENSRRPAGGVR